MRISPSLAAALILAAASSAATPGLAQGRACADLWYRRNAEYKAAGYCFHTAQGIRAFGNAGCGFDDVKDVPLSPGQQAAVADIVAQEREMGCR